MKYALLEPIAEYKIYNFLTTIESDKSIEELEYEYRHQGLLMPTFIAWDDYSEAPKYDLDQETHNWLMEAQETGDY